MLPSTADPGTGRPDPEKLLRAAELAEESGFDGVYVGDHLLHPHPILESVVSLAAVAATTSRVAIGPCVLLAALRDPLWLAKQLATLACFAPGRLRVGIGVGGEYPGEFAAAGVPMAERGRRTDEAMHAARRFMAEGTAQPGVVLAPLAPDVRWLVGGRADAALRRASGADGWIGYLLSPDGFGRRRARLQDLRDRPDQRDEGGSAGTAFVTGMLVPTHVDPSRGARAAAAASWSRLTDSRTAIPERLVVAGSPSEMGEQLHSYYEQGCTEFMLGVADQGGGYMDQVARLAADVLPLLRRM